MSSKVDFLADRCIGLNRLSVNQRMLLNIVMSDVKNLMLIELDNTDKELPLQEIDLLYLNFLKVSCDYHGLTFNVKSNNHNKEYEIIFKD